MPITTKFLSARTKVHIFRRLNQLVLGTGMDDARGAFFWMHDTHKTFGSEYFLALYLGKAKWRLFHTNQYQELREARVLRNLPELLDIVVETKKLTVYPNGYGGRDFLSAEQHEELIKLKHPALEL